MVGSLSKSLEDYLEAIVVLGGTTEQSVRASDVARKMGVSKTSAGKALTALRERGLLDQPYYGEATLTPAGFAYGEAILKRHRVFSAFLEQQIGSPSKTAEEEACLMEHAFSSDSFDKWIDYISRLGIAVDDA